MQKKWYGKHFQLGVLGGGQLGRMLIQETINYDVHVHSLDPDVNAPCKDVAHSFTVGSLNDFEAVYQFGKDKDVLTVEIENVSIEALEKLESEGVKVFPQPSVLKIIRDKGLQKQFYADNNIPTPDFYLVENKEDINKYITEFPFMQKMRTGGYDGKGVTPLRSESDLTTAFEVPSVLEKFVDFEKELSVIVARNENGDTKVYPTVECEFSPEANLVEFLFSPADVSADIEIAAEKLAIDIIDKLGMVGILAVELFLTKSGELLVNEIAPRPHNSGHHTIECNVTSQFEQHMRSVLNLPLGDTRIIQPGVMINLLGEKGYQGSAIYQGLEEAIALSGVKPHIYGKEETKSFRKMGHITIVAPTLEEAKVTGRKVKDMVKVVC
ncbi:MAG: 5-(carboxyamino)imidazole ribonucleotide synthase [Crocinitomicaceae bacterium]|nr:5-(carboxyamino)imidazole ribonucleotide synthase [Crocinitomicaceae bacterium]